MNYKGLIPNGINEISQSVVGIYAGGEEKAIISGSTTIFNTGVSGSFSGSFQGDGSQLTGLGTVVNGDVLESAFEEDENLDLMPTDQETFISVFYDYDENFDIMPRL